MIYLLIEARGKDRPLISRLDNNLANELFLDSLDKDTETLIKFGQNEVESYNPRNKKWEAIM